jgi:hypothetical protein
VFSEVNQYMHQQREAAHENAQKIDNFLVTAMNP